jgi:tyrosinase
MEGNPHGSAHVSFGGSISSIPTAAKDPLFFMLHANVDRLWAKWQAQFGRFNPTQGKSFDTNAAGGGNRIGHNLPDSMWPWNGVTTPPRPSTAPGGGLANSVCATMPGPRPVVRDCFDYQGKITPPSRLGFDYDDVAF